jgi:hypothetical protein
MENRAPAAASGVKKFRFLYRVVICFLAFGTVFEGPHRVSKSPLEGKK